MLLCLKVVYIVYNSHNLPVCFHFSSLFTNPNTHLTSHIPHPPLYNALTIVPLLVVAPSHCTAPLLNIIVLSHCNTAATLHCSNHFGYVLPLVASTDPFPWLWITKIGTLEFSKFYEHVCLVPLCEYSFGSNTMFRGGILWLLSSRVLKLVKDWVLGFDFLFFFLCLSIGMLG